MQREALLEAIMEEAQVFASAWSLVGGPFDNGDAHEEALSAKEDLRKTVREGLAALASAPAAEPVVWPIHWPTMPPSRGQSPVLFEDGYAEGWAKYLAGAASSAHEHYDMAFYSPPASDRLSEIEREWKAKLKAEQDRFDKYRDNAETAPKGREVLLWSTKYKQPISVGDWGSYCRMNQPCWTHWMEKPPAPVAAAAAKDKP